MKSIVALDKGSLSRNFNWILLLFYLTSADAHVEKSDRERLAVVFGVVQRLFSSEIDTELRLIRTGVRAWYYLPVCQNLQTRPLRFNEIDEFSSRG